MPSVAIAGYTNAGKSSLLNRLTGAGVLVENQLFATLDPTVRRAETEDGRLYTLADTVGFVRQLPTQLVEAFRSTLEEVADADLLLHVVDGSHPDPEGQISAVRAVLADVDAASCARSSWSTRPTPPTPRCSTASSATRSTRSWSPPAPAPGSTSCARSSPRSCRARTIDVEVLVPYDRGDLVSRLHQEAEVLSSEHTGSGTLLKARVHPDLAGELAAFAA